MKNFLAKIVATCVGFVTYSKRKLIGRLTRREDVNSSENENNSVMPDMEISKAMKAAIQTAAMRAKLLFDTYHWTWGSEPQGDRVPSVLEIVNVYAEMVNEVWAEAMKVENGETVGTGNAMQGRLTCEYADKQWTFGVELATTIEGDDKEGSEDEENEDNGLLKRKLANANQMDS